MQEAALRLFFCLYILQIEVFAAQKFSHLYIELAANNHFSTLYTVFLHYQQAQAHMDPCQILKS